MFAIAPFNATTTIDSDNGPAQRVPCRVIGVVQNGALWDFLVITQEDGDAWVAQRDHVEVEGGLHLAPSMDSLHLI